MLASIIVCAGCFWSVELFFQRLPGVVKTSVGYAGEEKGSRRVPPTYDEVVKGDTGLCEAVRIEYDTNTLSTDMLLDVFFELHDPYDAKCQGYLLFFVRFVPPLSNFIQQQKRLRFAVSKCIVL